MSEFSLNLEQLTKASKAVEDIFGETAGHILIHVNSVGGGGSHITFVTNLDHNQCKFVIGALLSQMDKGKIIPPPSSN
jgi:diaminopimelate decarboxylase